MNRDAAHTFSLYIVTIKNKKGRPPFILCLLDFVVVDLTSSYYSLPDTPRLCSQDLLAFGLPVVWPSAYLWSGLRPSPVKYKQRANKKEEAHDPPFYFIS